ncbi:MAG TPA: hypothetical protein EYG11_15350 [Candidatus Latescibacteria bacterium]|nr:hypothetical protein [Candidatus Handelsmanbacteria bacterium]HIL10076.1 hypothetical protein [Candidatus Latescibacterota bacterium]
MSYYFYTIGVCFLLCLAYPAFVLFARFASLLRMRQLGFRVRMMARGRGARLGSVLNAHPLFLFFFDRLSVEIERELVYLERDRHVRIPYHKRRLAIFPSQRLKLLTYRVERLEQSS